jgi:hypothetical protein
MSSSRLPYNSEKFELLASHGLWRPNCEGYLFGHNSDIRGTLCQSLKEAQERRQETFSAMSGSSALKRIKAEYGIDLRLQPLDSQDVVGLIGEILAESLVKHPDVKDTFVKWKTTGTSKSRGIDIVCRVETLESSESLLLLESKHVHKETERDSSLPSILSDKFRRGLDEFKEESVLLNLARLIVKLDQSIAVDRSVNIDPAQKERLKESIKNHLHDEDYDVLVVVFVDARFSDEKLSEKATANVKEPVSAGLRAVSLALAVIRNLGSDTDRMCKSYAT